jgi:hypothetical protein
MKERGLPTLLLLYSLILGTLFTGAALGVSQIRSLDVPAAPRSREKTVLDERITSAREIKLSLAKPMPRLEPLPPITAKAANPTPSKVARVSEDKPRKRGLSPQALNAMAMAPPSAASATSYPVNDRGSTGGW